MGLTFPDQVQFFNNVALINGVPSARRVDVPRTGTGEERVAAFFDQMIKALTDPLTAKEKESGMYEPPPPPRIIFEGTLLDAQEFFQQTTPANNCRNCPIAKYTDGLPVIIPTEEKVKEMLTGTSHSPDEQIVRYTHDAKTGELKKGTSKVVYALGYYATVEKVATVAVMAGCKPEYLPVILTVASSGGASDNCPGSSGARGFSYCVSGPIAQEIGMNAGQNAFDVGNPANMTIARTAALCTICIGGCITGSVRTDSGSPNLFAFAEDDEGLPPGWEGYNKESGYKKTESVLGKASPGHYSGNEKWGFQPSSFRGLNEGSGGFARALGVEGKPGYYNFLEYVAPLVIGMGVGGYGGRTFHLHPGMAKSLYDYGFKKKADVYQWLYDTYFITRGQYYNSGAYDFSTAAGEKIEPTSGKKWKDLPDDYPLHFFGEPMNNCIIVVNGFADEVCWVFPSRPTPYPIDPWR